jgi:hypothetical protein
MSSSPQCKRRSSPISPLPRSASVEGIVHSYLSTLRGYHPIQLPAHA